MWTVSHSITRTSHSNMRTQGALGQGLSALKNTCANPCPTWSRTYSPHLEPKASQKHLIPKVSKPFRQSLPNPWLPPLKGKTTFSREHRRFEGVKHDVIGTHFPSFPLPSPPSRPFSARPARSTSSAIGFKQNGHALQFTSEEMKGDRELCMAAVTQDWRSISSVQS